MTLRSPPFISTVRSVDAPPDAAPRLEDACIRAIFDEARNSGTASSEVARAQFVALCREFLKDPFAVTDGQAPLFTERSFALTSSQAKRAGLHELGNMLEELGVVMRPISRIRDAARYGALHMIATNMDLAVTEFNSRIVNRKWFEGTGQPFEKPFQELLETAVLNYYAHAADRIRRYERSGQFQYRDQQFTVSRATLQEHPRIWTVAEPLWGDFQQNYDSMRRSHS